MLPRIILLIVASILTTTGLTIAVMSGLERGTGFGDKFVYVGIAVCASLITQFLPSRKGGVKKWSIWFVAASVTMLVHMSYFAASTKTTGEVKAANSEAVTRVTQRVIAVTAARDSIVSRSVTEVTAALSVEPNARRRAALRSELSESNRKIKLSEQIDSLSGDLVTTSDTNASDAVTNLVTRASGVPASIVTLIYSFAFFMLIEMSSAYLWIDLMQKRSYTKTVGEMDGDRVVETKSESGVKSFFAIKRLSIQFKPATLNVPVVDSTAAETPIIDVAKQEATSVIKVISKRDQQLIDLSRDVSNGICDTSVRSIRQHLACSMNRATELARIVKVASVIH